MSGLLDQAGLTAGSGLSNGAGLYKWGNFNPFDPTDLDPYLLFDTAAGSMIGTLENPTLDLDPSNQETLDVITATRASVATRTLPDGSIALAEQDTVRVDYTQGAELTPTKFQNFGNTDFTSSLWVKNSSTLTFNQETAPDGTQTAAKYVGSGTAQDSYYNDTFTGPFTYSLFVKYINAPFIRLRNGSTSTWFDLTTVSVATKNHDSAAIKDVGDGWFRISVTVNSSSSFIRAYFYPHSTDNTTVEQDGGSFYLWGPQLEEGTTASDFVANTTGSPKFTGISATYAARVPMILVEPSSENLWGWSEGTLNDYQTNAVLYGGQYLSTDATSRNGLNSWLYFEPSSDTQVGFRMPVSVTSGSTMILSFYVIMDDGSKPRVGTSSTGSDTDFAILLQGVSSAGASGGVEHIDGDLYRVWAYRVFTGTSNGQYVYRYATHSGKGFKISGVMLEESSVPTSYIPTSGSAVTRAADDLEITGSDFDFYNQSEGTFYAESVLRNTSEMPFIFEASNNTLTYRLLSYYNVNNLTSYVAAAGTSVFAFGNRPPAGQLARMSLSYKTDNVLACLDGGTVEYDLSVTIPTNLTQLQIGQHLNMQNTYSLNGHIKRLLYFPTHSSRL